MPLPLNLNCKINQSVRLILWAATAAVVLFGCKYSKYKDFNPDVVEPVHEARLKDYADISLTMPRLEALKNDSQRLDSLIYLAEWLKNYDGRAARFYAERAYQLSTERNWKLPRAISTYRLAILKEQNGKFGEDFEDALVDINICRRIFDGGNEADWQARINALTGRLYLRKGRMDSVLHYNHKALECLKATSFKEQDRDILWGEIHHDLAISQALEDSITFEYFNLADSIYERYQKRADQARLRIDLARFYLQKNNLAAADSLLTKEIVYGKKSKDKDLLSKAYILKGHLAYSAFYHTAKIEEFHNALAFFKKSAEIRKEDLYTTYGYMGHLFYYRSAFHPQESDVDSAIVYYQMAIENAQKEGALKSMREVSNGLVTLCNSHPEKCVQLLKVPVNSFLNESYLAAVDSITKYSKAAFQRTNDVEQREIQMIATRERQIQIWTSAAALTISTLIFLLFIQQTQQKRLQARMEALRAQINPHFISNSLNAIESLVNLGNRKDAAKYIIHFSRLTRQILNGSRSPNTSLQKEITTLKHFLALEQLRFRDKLNYQIQISDALSPESISFPAMVLQPYVENAIWHGIKPKDSPGLLKILIEKEYEQLKCTIEDNGIGRERARRLKEQSVLKQKSIGMKITEERLRKMGKVKGSKVEIMDLYKSDGTPAGTQVILRLPLKRYETSAS